MRKIGSDEGLNFEVSGEKIETVHMLPGYTHNIINLSETEDLVTVTRANECVDPNKPDSDIWCCYTCSSECDYFYN